MSHATNQLTFLSLGLGGPVSFFRASQSRWRRAGDGVAQTAERQKVMILASVLFD
jgi:hypothetical protein